MLAPSFEGWELRVRRSRLLSVIVVGVAAIAIVATDIAVIPHRSHEIAVRHAAEKRVAYVEHLRAPLTALFIATQPLQNAEDYSGDGDPGADYAARDALAHTTAIGAVDKQLAAIKAIPVPKDLTAPAKTVVAAVAAVDADVKALPAQAKLEEQPLADSFTSGAFFTLTNDESTLFSAVDSLYGSQKRPDPPLVAPDGGAHKVPLPVSHDSWLLAADQACVAGLVASDAIQLPSSPTEAQLIAAGQQASAVESGVAQKIRRVPEPPDDATLRSLVARLALVDKQTSLYLLALRALQTRNLEAARADIGEAATYNADITAMANAYTAYGATECGQFYDLSDDSSGGSSGGSSSGSGGGQAT
jgi:hypothetical protein